MPAGRFKSSGGVSIVNAIGSGGYGGAAGISLWLEAEAREDAGVYGGESRWPGGSGPLPDPLVERIARAAARIAGRSLEGLWIEVKSEIPPGRGLKSSAALLTASLGAALDLLKASIPSEVLAVEAARLSLPLRLSATGALDDHAASVIDAPVVTMNPRFLIERQLPRAGCSYRVVIAYTSEVNPIHALEKTPFEALRRLYSTAASLALRGEWINAMTVNGLATAAVYGLDSLALRAVKLGAAAAGVTGKGPAFFSVTWRDSVDDVVGLLEDNGFSSVLVSRFRWCVDDQAA